MSTYKYDYEFNGGTLHCEFDFQPAEAQTHHYPGCAAEMDMTAAHHKCTDIYDLIDPNLKRVIEHKALEHYVQESRETYEDARIEAYRDRTEREYAW